MTRITRSERSCRDETAEIVPPALANEAGNKTRIFWPKSRPKRLLAGATAAAALSLAYMAFEAQWVRCRRLDLPVPGLPKAWSGVTILHLSDIHAGAFAVNERALAKVVRWAEPLEPDLVFLTGDIVGVGDPAKSAPCLKLLARIRPTYGMFAVTGNHEYGLSKTLWARPRETTSLWEEAGITLLCDRCVSLPVRDGTHIVLCGADHLSGGFGLLAQRFATEDFGAGDSGAEHFASEDFPILLIHDPPPADSPLAAVFPLAFAGHTHGGQLRIPTRSGLSPLHSDEAAYLGGVYPWGAGLIVVSRGIGTTLVPLRLLTRPEATLWRLVYTSPEH